MAAFVFLAGSELLPGSWDKCRAGLKRRGHTSRAIDWTNAPWGEGLIPGTRYLARQIEDIAEPILIGHSLAGLFLPLLAESVRARSEIYVAAFVPHPDFSMVDRMFTGEDIFAPDWVADYREITASPISVWTVAIARQLSIISFTIARATPSRNTGGHLLCQLIFSTKFVSPRREEPLESETMLYVVEIEPFVQIGRSRSL